MRNNYISIGEKVGFDSHNNLLPLQSVSFSPIKNLKGGVL